MAEFLYKDLSYSVIGAAMEVHRHLGPGFLERVYQKAMEHELTLQQIPFARQLPIIVSYKNIDVGKYRADFLIDEKIIVEVKGLSALVPVHEARQFII